MNLKTTLTTPVLFLTLALPCPALSQGSAHYRCSYGELERRVEIHTEPGVSVPCEVHYYKDTEAPGEREVLWSAASDAAYCEQKTAEFIGKLENWGWSCEQGSAAPVEPQAPPTPDTMPKPDTGYLENADKSEPSGDPGA